MSARELLRTLSVFADALPGFAAEAAAAEPTDQFLAWLAEAVESGVARPQLMTLATVDADGFPDARTLAVREVDGTGWWFATDATSPKSAQIAAVPRAALVFSWPEQGRQVRVRGTVGRAERRACAADFLMRPPAARAASHVGRQSRTLRDTAEMDRAFVEARERVAAQPERIAETYVLYVVRPLAVEFWQGRTDRKHTRLRYQLAEGAWEREFLWP
ncbi:pyridoxine/pyridoxamine 5'-phosphate oxidase [Yinghuangia sp. YIM S09857]|uniref:pyridoxine/pyridoxamine 5'-phosphate oxidase n=1 Tax=Yinghuangia sp. YIM S09857 TaxID=3436929 RepID=UPI003F52B391